METTTLEMKRVEADAENVWLRINMKVPTQKAIQVMQILKG